MHEECATVPLSLLVISLAQLEYGDERDALLFEARVLGLDTFLREVADLWNFGSEIFCVSFGRLQKPS